MDNGHKASLVNLCNSEGWLLAKNLGESILKELDGLALECEDDTKIAGLVREARASRKFWNAFLSNVDNAKQPVDDTFIEVSY
jgi:hypothetical protein